MKKISKKLSAVLMTIILSCVMLLSTAVEMQAATLPYKRVVTLYSSNSKNYNSFLGKYVSANICNVSIAGGGAKFQSVKTSNTKKATTVIKKGTGSSKGTQAILATFKQAGNVSVEYKMYGENDTKKQNFVAKKYINPLKSLTINGKNIASKFKKDNVYILPYAQYAGKKIKISYKPASNFEITSVCHLLKPGDMQLDMVENNTTIKVQKKNSSLIIGTYNTKTEQSETCLVIFQ